MANIKVNINPFHLFFSLRGRVFKLIHEGQIPHDIKAISDFVINSDGTVLKHRYPEGSPQLQFVVDTIRRGTNVEEVRFDNSDSLATHKFFQKLVDDCVSVLAYSRL